MTADQIRSLPPALAALLEQFSPFCKREGTFRHWERWLLGLTEWVPSEALQQTASCVWLYNGS